MAIIVILIIVLMSNIVQLLSGGEKTLRRG